MESVMNAYHLLCVCNEMIHRGSRVDYFKVC